MVSHTPGTTGCGVSNINLFKINTFVRTKYEEAARRYGSEKRTAVLFPPSPKVTDQVVASSTASKSKTSRVSKPALKPDQSAASTTTKSAVPPAQDQQFANRWSFKSFTNVLVSSSEGSEMAHYYAENQHMETGISLSRSLAEEDPIQMDIQRMRNDFVRHNTLHAGIQHPPPHMLDVLKTPVVSSRSDFRNKGQAFVPRFRGQHLPKENVVRHVRPLFRKNPFTDQNKIRPWEEKDFVPDDFLVEENSPPRPSYHIYRVNVDGTTFPLPLTVMPATKKTDQASTPAFNVQESMSQLATVPQLQTPVLQGPATCGPGRQICQSKDGRLPSRNIHDKRTEIDNSSTKANKTKKSKGAQKESLVFVSETASKNGRPGGSDDISKTKNNAEDDVEIIKICKKSDTSAANFILLSSDSSPELQDSDRNPNLNSASSREPVTNSKGVNSENLDGKLSRSLEDDELPDLSMCNKPKPNGTESNLNENLKDHPSTSEMNEVTLKDIEENKSGLEDDEESLPETIIFLLDALEASVPPPNDVQVAAEKDKCDGKESGESLQNCDNDKCVQIDSNDKVTFQLLSTSFDGQNDNGLQETNLFKPQIGNLENEIVRNTDKREINFVKESSINVHSILGYKDRYKLVRSELIVLFPAPGPISKTKTQCSEMIDLFPVPVPDMEQSVAIKGTLMNVDITHTESSKFLEARVFPSSKESGRNDASSTNLVERGTEAITDDLVIEDALWENQRILVESKDYCEFADLSSLIFVSDGKTVFRIQRKEFKNLECENEFIRKLASLNLSAGIDKTGESLKSNYEHLETTNCGIPESSICKVLNDKEALKNRSFIDTSEKNQDLLDTVSVAELVPNQIIVSTSSVNFLSNDLKNQDCNNDSKCRESKDETVLKNTTTTAVKDSKVCVEECSQETLSKTSYVQKESHEENKLYPVHSLCIGKTAYEIERKKYSSDNEKGNIVLLDKDSQNVVHPEIKETLEELLARERQSFIIDGLVKEFILMGERKNSRQKRQSKHKYLKKQETCYIKKAELHIGLPTKDLQKHERNIVQEDKEYSPPNVIVKANHCICTEINCSCPNKMAGLSSHKDVMQANSHTNKKIRKARKVSREDSGPIEVTRAAFDPNKVIVSISETREINTAASDKESSSNVYEKSSQCPCTERNCSCSGGVSEVSTHIGVTEANLDPNVETKAVSKVSGEDFGLNEVTRTAFGECKVSGSISVSSEMYSAAFDKELIPSALVEISRCTCSERNCSCSNRVSELSYHTGVTKANSSPNEEVRVVCKVSGADSETNEVAIIAFDKKQVTGPVSETSGMNKASFHKESSPNVFVNPNQCICAEENCSCSNGRLEASNHTGVIKVKLDLNEETKVVLETDSGQNKATIAIFDQNKVTRSVSEPIEVTTAVVGPNKVCTPASNQNKSTAPGFDPNEKIGVTSGINSAMESRPEPNEVAVTNLNNEEVIHSETKYIIKADKSDKGTDIDCRTNGVTKVQSLLNETSKVDPELKSMTEVRSNPEVPELDTEHGRRYTTSDNRHQAEEYFITDTFAKPVCYSRMVNVVEKSLVVGMLEIHNLEYTSENRSSHEASGNIKENNRSSHEVSDNIKESRSSYETSDDIKEKRSSYGASDNIKEKRSNHEASGNVKEDRSSQEASYNRKEKRSSHEASDNIKEKRSSHEASDNIKEKTRSSDDASGDIKEKNRSSHEASDNIKENRSSHEASGNIKENNRSSHEESDNIKKNRSSYEASDNIKEDRSSHEVSDNIKEERSNHEASDDIKENRSSHEALDNKKEKNRSSREAPDNTKETCMNDQKKSNETTGHDIGHKDEPVQKVEDDIGGKRMEDNKGNEIEDTTRGIHQNKEMEVTEQDSRNLKIMSNFQSNSGTNPPKTSQSYSLGELMNRISAKIDQLKRRDTSFNPKKKYFEVRNKRVREFDSTMKQFMENSKKVKSSVVPKDMSEIHSKNEDTGPVNSTVTHTVSQQIPDVCAQHPKYEYGDEKKNENKGAYQIFKSNSEVPSVHNMQSCGSIQTETESHKCVNEYKKENKDSCESNLICTVEPEKQQYKKENKDSCESNLVCTVEPEKQQVPAMQFMDNSQIITPVSDIKQFLDNTKIQLINDSTYDSSGYVCQNEKSVINKPLLQITDNQETKEFPPISVSNEESQTVVEQQSLDTHKVMSIPKQLTEDEAQFPCSEISHATEKQTSDVLERPSSEESTGDNVHPCVSSVVTSASPVLRINMKLEPGSSHSTPVEGYQFQRIRENDQISELQSLRNLAKLYNDPVTSLKNIHMASSHKGDDIPREIDKGVMADCVDSNILVQIPAEEHHFPPKVTSPAVCLPVSQGFSYKSDSQMNTSKLKSDDPQLSSDTVRSKINNSCATDEEVHDQESSKQGHNSSGKGTSKRKSNTEGSDAESSWEDDDNALSSTCQRSRKKQRSSLQRIAVPLNEFYQKCLKKLEDAGETLLQLLKMESLSLPKFDRGFLSIKAGITRFLLNQLVRTRNLSADHKCAYQNLLMVHGLVKAADLLMHCGLDSAKQCLQEFSIAHQTLIPNCYDQLLSELETLTSEKNFPIHPKVQILKKELKVARKMGNSSDSDFKVLVVCKRESESVCQQLQKSLGASKVGLLPAVPAYQQVLQLIDEHSILVWSEGNGVDQIPCSQFTLAVEWEASETHNTRSCVGCCLRQNIQVIALYTVVEGSSSCAENSRLEFNVAQSKGKSSEGKPEIGEGADETATKEKATTYTFVASEVVTDNAELHYLLSSVYNINLVERRLRDLVEGEHSERGWADIVVDERTGILLRPLIYLRHDPYRNDITQQLILLSLQFTKCYLILYQHPPYGTRYVFGNRVVKSLNRLVATCGLLKRPDYQVSLLYAYDLQQVGQIVRTIAESALRSSVSWDEDQWISRPWLTPAMSSHERLLLSLPCLNPISAQVILTVMPLRNVLKLPLPTLIQSLPWISNKVLTTMHHLIHSKHSSTFREEMNESLDVMENIKTPSRAHQANLVAPVHPVTNPYANLNSHSEGSFSEDKFNEFCLNPRSVNDETFAVPTFQDKSLNFDYNDNRDILEEIKQDDFNGSTTFKESFNQDVSALLNPKEFLSRIADDSSPKREFTDTCFLGNEDEIKKEPKMNGCHQEQMQLKHPEPPISLDIGQQTYTANLQYQQSNHEGQFLRRQSFENICQNPGATSQLQSHTSQVIMSPLSFVLDNPSRNSREQSYSKLYSPTQYQDQPSFSQFPVTSPYFDDDLKVPNNGNVGYPGTQVFTGDQTSSQAFLYSTSSSIYSHDADKSIIGPLSMTDQRNYHDITLDNKISNRSFISNEDQIGKETSMEPSYQNVPGTWQSVHYQDVHSSAQPSLASQQIFDMTGITLPHQRESMTSPPLPPPSPLVTLRQDGRGNDYPDHYEFPTSQVKIPRSSSNMRLGYTKVPGEGGQTKLVFHPRKTIREKDCPGSRDLTPSQIRLPTPSPLTFQSARLGYTKPEGRGGQTKLAFKAM